MTRDEIIEIIELAREAGLGFFRTRDSDNTSVDALVRFTALVAEATKEKCVSIAIKYAENTLEEEIEAMRNIK